MIVIISPETTVKKEFFIGHLSLPFFPSLRLSLLVISMHFSLSYSISHSLIVFFSFLYLQISLSVSLSFTLSLYQSHSLSLSLSLFSLSLSLSHSTGHPIGVTVEDIINGRSLHPEMARRIITNSARQSAGLFTSSYLI